METACAKPTVTPQTFKSLTRVPVKTFSVPEPHDPLLYEVLVAGIGTTGVHLAAGHSSHQVRACLLADTLEFEAFLANWIA